MDVENIADIDYMWSSAQRAIGKNADSKANIGEKAEECAQYYDDIHIQKLVKVCAD